VVKSIEAPDYSLAAMTSDGARKRSVEVTHRNLPALYFRAFTTDLVARVASARDYNLLPAGDELRRILREGKPAAEWKVDLPATPDFKSHRTFVTPPLEKPGLYVVVASAKADFSTGSNRILGTNVLVSNLVLVVRAGEPTGAVEALALSGDTGKPVSGARVSLYRYDWQAGHKRVETKTVGADGVARFEFSDERASRSHFLLAKNGGDLALDPNYIGFYRQVTPGEATASLVYTDRSIYRPLQKLHYKVVAYHGRPDAARYETLPEAAVEITLFDPNNQKVDSALLTTNAYGSAAGEFTIPTGRVLGVWRVQSSLLGQAAIRVEEYKRPTFETKLLDPKDPLRLNRKASLRGEARYYFGLPVVNGNVRWRVTREPVYPWWWGWWFYGGRSASSDVQTVATGTSLLKEDGTFDLSFTPAADEKKSKGSRDVTYRYHVVADVTDEGGETRTADRSFRLGFFSVEARVDTENGFTREGDAATLSITRSDLDGTPRAGKGSFRVYRVDAPERALLPAEMPVSAPPRNGEKPVESEGLKTPGDLLRARWQGADSWDRVVFSWPDGREVKSGEATHDEKGLAKVEIAGLSPGVYRLKYETVDDFGATFKTTKDFVVGGKKSPLPIAALLLHEKP
ncbi:MAG TPA: MG2 domain-containing protein, partial [Thermoanaerobaculia bacterium]|nr:MG2 domain-containing protein [Thermoanaerobaculia bacterium]